MEGRLDQVFQIGRWRIYPRLNRIEREDVIVGLEPKMMEVLVLLAECAGEVLSRREILDRVWSDTVVGEEVVSRSISELRKAFGDDPRTPEVIETIHKSGYRLIAPVSFERHARSPVPSWDSPARRTGARAIVAALAAVGLAVAGYVVATRPASAPQRLVRTVPVTTFLGTEFHPALSPDGRRLAFIWTGGDGGPLDLYVKTIESETPLRLTETLFYEYSPAWSPDGSEIAVGRYGEGIFIVPALGGPERKVIGVHPTSRPHVAWSPAGDVLAYTDHAAPNAPYRVHLLSLETMESRPITNPPAGHEGDAYPAFSPDGRSIAFVRFSAQIGDIYVASLDGSEPRRITDDHVEIAGLDWADDRIVFSSNRGGTFNLWRISPSGGDPEAFTIGGTGDLKQPSFRASRVAYTQSFTDENIWRVDSDGVAAPYISSTRIDVNPQHSPDGERIAFASSRSSSMEVWVSRVDGSEPMRLTSFEGTGVANPRWSPGGDLLVFDHGGDLYTVEAQGGRVRRLTSGDAADAAPTWSLDGEALYFGSRRSGDWQLWRMEADGGDPVQITRDGGYMGLESAAGELYFTRLDAAGLWKRNSDESEERVFDLPGRGDWGNWALAGENAYVLNRSAQPPVVEMVNLESRTSRSRFVLPKQPTWGRSGLSISPDGSTLLYSQVDHSYYDIMLSEEGR